MWCGVELQQNCNITAELMPVLFMNVFITASRTASRPPLYFLILLATFHELLWWISQTFNFNFYGISMNLLANWESLKYLSRIVVL